MSDWRTRPSVIWAPTVFLLMVVAAAAASEDRRLVDAMKQQDPQRVRALLLQHADVNGRFEDGSTAAGLEPLEFHARFDLSSNDVL